MICPLLSHAYPKTLDMVLEPCKKDDCAWWVTYQQKEYGTCEVEVRTIGKCAIVGIVEK